MGSVVATPRVLTISTNIHPLRVVLRNRRVRNASPSAKTSKRSDHNLNVIKKMSSTGKGWIVAAIMGAVETMKDQLGLCRWNYAIRLFQQQARSNLRSATKAKNKLSFQSSIFAPSRQSEEKATQAEESLRTIMYLSCWGSS